MDFYYKIKGHNLWHSCFSECVRHVERGRGPVKIITKPAKDMTVRELANVATNNVKELT